MPSTIALPFMDCFCHFELLLDLALNLDGQVIPVRPGAAAALLNIVLNKL